MAKQERCVFNIQDFCKCFYTSSSGEKDVSCSERICISYRQRGWEKVKRSQFWEGHNSVPKTHKQIRSEGFWGLTAPSYSFFVWIITEIATWKLILNLTGIQGYEQSFVRAGPQLLTGCFVSFFCHCNFTLNISEFFSCQSSLISLPTYHYKMTFLMPANIFLF